MSTHRIRDDTGWCCRGPARRLARVAVVRGKAYHNRLLLRLSAMISQYFMRRILYIPTCRVMPSAAVDASLFGTEQRDEDIRDKVSEEMHRDCDPKISLVDVDTCKNCARQERNYNPRLTLAVM